MSQAARNPDGGCWAHNSGVYREPAYRWWLVSGNVVDLCAECTAAWQLDPSGLSGPPLRIAELPRIPAADEPAARRYDAGSPSCQPQPGEHPVTQPAPDPLTEAVTASTALTPGLRAALAVLITTVNAEVVTVATQVAERARAAAAAAVQSGHAPGGQDG